MPDTLKQKIVEFVAIARECPDPFQLKCFELLLADYLSHQHHRAGEKEKKAEDKEGLSLKETKEEKEPKKAAQQEDIQEIDLHMKARQFLKKHSLSIDLINNLFYKEEGNFLPLYDDLKTTKIAESQIRVALLHSLLKGMHTGDFEFSGEAVREEVKIRKCYDQANFAAVFKQNQTFFEGFDKYSKGSPTIKLNAEGKERLAEIIKELQ